MSRQRGIFNQSSNYEPLISAPLDARTVVTTRASLVTSATWLQAGNTTPYLYNGLLVAVTRDTPDSNNGLYMLIDAANYNVLSSWRKIADIRDIDALNEKIDSIVPGGGGGAVQVESRGNLPNIGSENTVYFVKNENATYRWDDAGLRYYCVGRDYEEINAINGGNASEFKQGE